jgi:hypothetical protein
MRSTGSQAAANEAETRRRDRRVRDVVLRYDRHTACSDRTPDHASSPTVSGKKSGAQIVTQERGTNAALLNVLFGRVVIAREGESCFR